MFKQHTHMITINITRAYFHLSVAILLVHYHQHLTKYQQLSITKYVPYNWYKQRKQIEGIYKSQGLSIW